jgi:nicotinamide-nucleotide amidase
MIDALAAQVGQALKAAGATLATAESCTGGWVAQAITSVAGSSDWFERGYVTYSNAAKRDDLGVAADIIERHGAVSEETARAMAAGALKKAGATTTLAVTGVAGPGGGSAQKPVGTVCFAWARGGKIRSETKRFDGDRESVRRQSVIHALQGVLELL